MLYCKLVRDNIPEIIGEGALVDTLTDKEFAVFLERKLDEELAEYHESHDAEELVDILEVVIALAETKGLSFDDLMALRNKKAEEKGTFSQKVFLIAVRENL